MKLFLISTLVLTALILVKIDLRIQKNTVVKERVLLQSRNRVLIERQKRIEAEIQMELGDPDLQEYLLTKMKFHRDHKKSLMFAIELKKGDNDGRIANQADESPSQP